MTERKALYFTTPSPAGIDEAGLDALLQERRDWRRLQSRERDKTQPTKKLGDWVEFKQIIVRAGYWLSPADMPEEEALERAYQQVVLTANQYRAGMPSDRIVKSPVGNLGLGIDEYIVRAVVKALGPRSERNILRGALWGARQEWANEMRWLVGKRDPTIDLDLRTFWYRGLPETFAGQISRVCGRWIGRYHKGSPASSGYWGITEPEPPYLENWLYQQIYEVQVWHAGTMLVHPLDVDPARPSRLRSLEPSNHPDDLC